MWVVIDHLDCDIHAFLLWENILLFGGIFLLLEYLIRLCFADSLKLRYYDAMMQLY